MLQLITIGNTYKYLQQIYLYKNGLLSYYTYKTNKIILPVKYHIKVWDNLNKIATNKTISGNIKISNNYIFNFIKNSYIIIWTRIVFRGKGFRIRNFQKELKLTFNFGHSHWDKLKLYKLWWFFKLRRQSYVVLTFFINYLFLFERLLSRVRIVNRYTNRGLRIKKQPIIQRFGKISQVVSLLH